MVEVQVMFGVVEDEDLQRTRPCLASGIKRLRQQLQCRECSTTQQRRDGFSVYGELKTREVPARSRSRRARAVVGACVSARAVCHAGLLTLHVIGTVL